MFLYFCKSFKIQHLDVFHILPTRQIYIIYSDVSQTCQVKQPVAQPGPKQKGCPWLHLSPLCWYFSHCASHKLLSQDVKSLGCLFYPYRTVGSFRSSIWESLATAFMLETRPGDSNPNVFVFAYIICYKSFILPSNIF